MACIPMSPSHGNIPIQVVKSTAYATNPLWVQILRHLSNRIFSSSERHSVN